MPKNTLADLESVAANNTDVLGQSTLGKAPANTLDQVDRAILALLARFYMDLGGVVTVGGSGDGITVTSASTYQTLEDGVLVGLRAKAANIGPTTLNLDSLGAKPVFRAGGAALNANDLQNNGFYLFRYDLTLGGWLLLNPAGPDAASVANFLARAVGKVLTADKVWDAAAPVNLGNLAGAVPFDFSTFIGAYGTLVGNITADGTANLKPGQSGTLTFIQSGGPWTLSVNTAYFETADGKGITLGAGRNKVTYEVQENGKVFLALAGKSLA